MSSAAFGLAFLSILLWSSLAYVGARLTHLPPLFLVGAGLTLAGLFSLPRWRDWRVPLPTLLVGVGGLFGYHYLYFSAFHSAPVVEANLINYLWPLLIVLLTPVILKGSTLKAHHLLGAGLGFAGAALIVTGGHLQLDLAYLKGYLLAAGAALIWAVYSLLTKRLPPFSTGAVGAFCLASGLLSIGCYLASHGLENAWPVMSAADWVVLGLASAGPLGLAFFTWDAALKRGDSRLIGSLSYLTPLLSTTFLVLGGGGHLAPLTALAMVLIIAGAAIGSLDSLLDLRKSRARRLSPE